MIFFPHSYSGVSTSNSASYDVTSAVVPGETPLSDIMQEAATAIGQKQQVDLDLAEIDVDNEHAMLSGQT